MELQHILELLGIAFFAVSGALVANQKSKPDWFGVTFIGFITSIGGGSIRDIFLGSYPLSWVKDPTIIYVIIASIVITSLFFNKLVRFKKIFFIFDTLGISMFTILGTEKALNFHVDPAIAAIMGMFSAILGGVIRDVLTNQVPVIFRKEIYATACLAGAIVYLILDSIKCERYTCLIISTCVIVMIRVIAVKYQLSLPQFKREK